MTEQKFTVVLVGWSEYPEYDPSIKELTDQTKNDKDYVILSEPIELVFVPLSPEAVLQGRMGKLQQIKTGIVNEFGEKLASINDTIAKCQSLGWERQGKDQGSDYPTFDPAAPCEDAFKENVPFAGEYRLDAVDAAVADLESFHERQRVKD